MDRQRIVCPDGIARVVTGVLRVPGEPDRYETNDGAWRVWECEQPPAPPVRRRNYTRELLAAAKRGSRIVCSIAPYDGTEVEYAPRNRHDSQPWVAGDTRYTGRECRAVDSEEHMEETDKATHLLGALSGGHTIVVAAGRFADWPVEYTPRSKGDERPWASRQGWVTYRYTHAECRVRGES